MAVLICLLGLGGCSGADVAPAPIASLAGSRTAQDDFDDLHARWLALAAGERASLEGRCEGFLDRHGDDATARLVRVYLAFILIRQGQLDEAERLIAPVRAGPPGRAQDFATVAEAGLLIRRSQPEQALQVLEPLRGKIVDPAERLLFGEQYVHAAIESQRWGTAVDAMVAWVANVDPEQRAAVERTVQRLVRRIPTEELERHLERLDTEAVSKSEASSRAPARDWLRQVARDALRVVALEERDTELARRLIEGGPAAPPGDGSERELASLAASGLVRPRVDGRALGFVLEVGSDTARRRSALVAAGMSRALGLPASGGQPGAVQLLLRDASAEPDDLNHALAELAGMGAAILVAGVVAESSPLALQFAERSRIPTLLLTPPTEPPRSGDYAFQLGVTDRVVEATLRAELRARDSRAIVTVGSAGLDCDPPQLPRTRNGQAPPSVVVLGGPTCANAVARSLASQPQVLVAFGLESGIAAEALPTTRPRLLTAAGQFPDTATPGSHHRTQAPTAGTAWYEALGIDAARLGAATMTAFPTGAVEEPTAVERRHQEVRDQLARVSVGLYTSDQRGFAGHRTLPRSLRVVEYPPGKKQP